MLFCRLLTGTNFLYSVVPEKPENIAMAKKPVYRLLTSKTKRCHMKQRLWRYLNSRFFNNILRSISSPRISGQRSVRQQSNGIGNQCWHVGLKASWSCRWLVEKEIWVSGNLAPSRSEYWWPKMPSVIGCVSFWPCLRNQRLMTADSTPCGSCKWLKQCITGINCTGVITAPVDFFASAIRSRGN